MAAASAASPLCGAVFCYSLLRHALRGAAACTQCVEACCVAVWLLAANVPLRACCSWLLPASPLCMDPVAAVVAACELSHTTALMLPPRLQEVQCHLERQEVRGSCRHFGWAPVSHSSCACNSPARLSSRHSLPSMHCCKLAIPCCPLFAHSALPFAGPRLAPLPPPPHASCLPYQI